MLATRLHLSTLRTFLSQNSVRNGLNQRNIWSKVPALSYGFAPDPLPQVQSHQNPSQTSLPNVHCVSCRELSSYSRAPLLERKNFVISGPSPCRDFSSAMSHSQKGPSLLTRLMWKVGIGRLRYGKTKMRLAAYKLYMCCDELVDHFKITQELGLPDTFYSWYLSMELHVWLMMVRLHQEGPEGKYVRHMLVKALWDDVENRSKQLGDSARTTARKVGIKEIGDHFQAALFAYDEGALSDDRVLAAALWRIIFEMKDVDPALLELLVAYVRKQLKHLDTMESYNLLQKGQTTFLPLYGDDLNKEESQERMEKIMARNI